MLYPTVLLACCLLGAGDASATQGYVGAQSCGSCHAFAYQVWQSSPHARAHQSLDATQRQDGRCINCHATGSATSGAPSTSTRTSGEAAGLVGVQCESCHGPGKYYQAAYVMKDRELARAVGLVEQQPALCLHCHTNAAPSVRPFDFKAAWALIDHGKAAEQRWAAMQGNDAAAAPAPGPGR